MTSSLIQIQPVNPRAILHCGDAGKFTVTVLNAKKNPVTRGEVVCTFQDEHFRPVAEIRHNLAKGNPFVVTETLQNPGFLRCDVTYKEKTAFAVIAFDPDKIESEQSHPADFEAFWKQERATALQLPLDVKLEKLDRLSSEDYTGYAINFANINDTRMYGYLSVPTKPGPHPAGIIIPGAGPGFTTVWDEFPLESTIVLALNVHPYAVEPETMQERYEELNREEFYYFHGLPDLRKYVFFRVIMGICRGVKYLREREDWDQKHIGVTGSSQGGGLTIATAAVNNDVITAAAVNVPAFGELVLGVRPADNNWSKIRSMPVGPELTSYLDASNFAPLIRCPFLCSIGLRDESCYPVTIYAPYNRIRSEKFMWITPSMGHAFDPEYNTCRKLWLAEHSKR